MRDAFDVQDWGSHGLLWRNPPFSQLGEVVIKLIRDRDRAVLIVPYWPDQKWYHEAQPFIVRCMKFPRGTRVFDTRVGKIPGVRWRTCAWLVDASVPLQTAANAVQGVHVKVDRKSVV